MLTTKQISLAKTNWKNGKPLGLSMTFVGSIRPNGQTRPNEEPAPKKNQTPSDTVARERLAEEVSDPSTQPEDTVDPTEEDFVFATFRALSATILADRPIDFTDEKMLKRAVSKLNGQTVFKDHNTSVNNWLGRVESSHWDDTTAGFPSGINAILKLDTVKDPMTVRGVLQGAIHSASVTVSFEWKPSHPALMETGTFFDHLGEEIEDETVRIIVTKIDKFWEISLVWQGADEFAKQIGEDGRPVQQARQLETVAAQATHPTNHQEPHMNALSKLLQETFGVEVTEMNFIETLSAHVEGKSKTLLQKTQQEMVSLQSQLDQTQQRVTEFETKIRDLEPQASLGRKYLEDERKEAVRLYRLAKGDQVSEAILKTLEKAELDIAQAFKQEFQKEVEAKFPNRCAKCGGTDIRRQSSQMSQDQGQPAQGPLSRKALEHVKEIHAL
ncbi:MAG: hypothetical protein HY696_09205 [Deltaproteobacteria bacterium]|nr:hypothetical protein [Deltaproteobacteria bacterium]